MELTIGIVVYAMTLLAGEITKASSIPNKYIPLQNVTIAIISSVICITFGVEGLGVLETIITCIFASLSAGGTADLKKIAKKD